MTPRCTNCLHWDEDRLDPESGEAPCCEWRNATVMTFIDTSGRRTLRPIAPLTTGDHDCGYFKGKTVPHVGVTHDTNPSSEAD